MILRRFWPALFALSAAACPEAGGDVEVEYVLDPVPPSAVLVEGARTTLTMTAVARTSGEPPTGEIFLQWRSHRTPAGSVELSASGAFTFTPLVFGNSDRQTERLSLTLR